MSNKITEYIQVIGIKNIQTYLQHGLQPYGNPWVSVEDNTTLHQVMVRYLVPEVAAIVSAPVITPTKTK